MFAGLVGAASLAIWVYLLVARGGFWRVHSSGTLGFTSRSELPPWPAVAVIVPARNEADVVSEAIQSLCRQDYPGPFHIFLVDDESTDGTGEIARGAAEAAGRPHRLTVIPAKPRAQAWTGKVWAMSEGVTATASLGAEYLLFTDADIVHAPNNMTQLVERATAGTLDLVSLMARLSCDSRAERMLIPAFVFFFLMLYPPCWVSDPQRRTAAAAGGCMLVRAEALRQAGGLETIRAELIDDCALARALKQRGKIWLGLAGEVKSVRRYKAWTEIGRMIARTAFTELQHSAALLAATVAAMLLVFVAPLVLVGFRGWPAAIGLAGWMLMSIAYAPMLRYCRTSPLAAPLLPLTALFYTGATIHSALQYWSGKGGAWKGRIQDPSKPGN